MSTAALFAAAHLGKAGISVLQLICITSTGSLYGWIRLRFRSTAATALTHAAYNLSLYINDWITG